MQSSRTTSLRVSAKVPQGRVGRSAGPARCVREDERTPRCLPRPPTAHVCGSRNGVPKPSSETWRCQGPCRPRLIIASQEPLILGSLPVGSALLLYCSTPKMACKAIFAILRPFMCTNGGFVPHCFLRGALAMRPQAASGQVRLMGGGSDSPVLVGPALDLFIPR
jgi:hypothetical protein